MITHEQLRNALRQLYPTADYVIRDGVLDWVDPNIPKPTLEEITRQVQATEYVTLRRAEYPSIEDQLDAIWKGGEDAERMRARILDIKRKFPKP